MRKTVIPNRGNVRIWFDFDLSAVKNIFETGRDEQVKNWYE